MSFEALTPRSADSFVGNCCGIGGSGGFILSFTMQRGLLQPPTSSVPHIRVYHILRRWCQAVRDVKTYGRVHSVPYEHRYPLYHQRDGLDRICENV